MILARQPKYLEFILACNKIKGGPRFLNYPGCYPEFLKQIFQVLSIDKEIKLNLVIAKQDVTKIVQQSKAWTLTPFKRERATKRNILTSNDEVAIKDGIPNSDVYNNLDGKVTKSKMDGKSQQLPFKKVIRLNKKIVEGNLVAENSHNNNSKDLFEDKMAKKTKKKKKTKSLEKSSVDSKDLKNTEARNTSTAASNKEHNRENQEKIDDGDKDPMMETRMDDDLTVRKCSVEKQGGIEETNKSAAASNKEQNRENQEKIVDGDKDQMIETQMADDLTVRKFSVEKEGGIEEINKSDLVANDECTYKDQTECAMNDDKSVNADIIDGTYVGTLVFNGNSNILKNDSYSWILKSKKKAVKLWREYSCINENCNATKFAKKAKVYQKWTKSEWRVEYRIPHTCENKQLLKPVPETKKATSTFLPADTNKPEGDAIRTEEDTRIDEVDTVIDESMTSPKNTTEENISSEDAVRTMDSAGHTEVTVDEVSFQHVSESEENSSFQTSDDKLRDYENQDNDHNPVTGTDEYIVSSDNVEEQTEMTKENSIVNTNEQTEALELRSVHVELVSDINDKTGENEKQNKCSDNNDIDSSLPDIPYTSHQNSMLDDLSNDSSEDSSNCDSGINVEFPVGSVLRKYKLIQLSKQPNIDGRGIIAEADIAVIVCNKERNFKERGHFDCFNWGKMSKGKLKKIKIGSYSCTEKSKGCIASKRKWICSGNCEFSNNFCCDYSIPGFDSLVSLYTNKHTHSPPEMNAVRIEDFIDGNSDVETKTQDKGPVSSTPIRSSNQQNLTQDCESSPSTQSNDEMLQTVTSSREIEAKLKSSFSNPKFSCYKSSKIKATSISKISSDDMSDTFHIIEKSEDIRAFDACKDGFEYKRGSTRKIFPSLFPNQQVHKYECYGRLKCVNHLCPIFQRLSKLSYAVNKANASKVCSHCLKNLVEDCCSGKKFIIHSQSSRFAVVYYSMSHSCGNQDWVLDPKVIEQLTALFETNDTATSAVAYKKLFEEKLRIALNEKNKEIQNTHIEDLISVVNSCTQDHVAKNVKKKVIKAKTPLGRGIEAVKILRESTSLIYDKLGIIIRVVVDSYVCATCKKISYTTEEDEEIQTECCNHGMVNTGPVILVTSKDNLKSADEMSKDGGIFNASTVHVDHQPARCKTMDTLNVAFYDHNLREMSSVFMTHSMGENQYNVLFEFKLFESVMQEQYGDDYKFNPFGFTSDNAGGITAGIKLCFGPLKPHRTCRFHIIYCGYQHCGTSIGSKKDQILFLRYLFSLIDASTATLFVEISEKFWKWINELPSRTKQLENWWDFWFNCRAMWSSAFTNQTLTEVSLVESLQSKYSKKNNLKNLPLYQSVVFAMSDLTKYSARLNQLGKGKYMGQGPSITNLEERDMIKELEKVKKLPLSTADFENIFKQLGLPYEARIEEEDEFPADLPSEMFASPIAREKSERHRVLASFTPSPIAKHTFKKPTAPKSSQVKQTVRKPGRPPKSKTKTYVSRFSQELDFSDEDSDDPTLVMDDDFVPATTSICDEILFNTGKEVNAENPPQRTSSRPQKSKIKLSSLFVVDESDVETQLMDDNHVAAAETFEGEIEFNKNSGHIDDNLHGVSGTSEQAGKEAQMDVDNDLLLNMELGINSSEEDWCDSIDWDESVLSQNTMDQLMNEFEPSSTAIDAASHCDARKRVRVKDSVHYKKQKSKAFQQQDQYDYQKISDNSFQIKDKGEINKKGNKLLAFGNKVKIVNFNFDEKEVCCSCEAWKTEKLYKSKGDEVCKHVPLVILKCDKKLADQYFGNRSLAVSDITNLQQILETFDGGRMIENPENSLEPVLSKKKGKSVKKRRDDDGKYLSKKFMLVIVNSGPFASKETALAAAPKNSWYGELYSVGGNPACRSCGKKINVKGQSESDRVVIRTDVAFSFLPQTPNAEYILKVDTIRVCLNNFCHRNLPRKAYRTVNKMEEIILKFLPYEYHQKYEEAFRNTSITLSY